MKSLTIILVLCFTIFMILTPAVFAENSEPTFTDVPEIHHFYDEIEALATAGVTEGFLEGDGTRTYRPGVPFTRMAAAAFLDRAFNLEGEHAVPGVPTFTDVPLDHPFFDEIERLYAAGITDGWEEGDGTRTYRPGVPFTRMAAAAFLDRAFNLEAEHAVPGVPTFTDVAVGHPFFDEIERLYGAGITDGWEEDDGTRTYRPGLAFTRMAAAAFLYRGLGLDEFDEPEVLEVLSVEAINRSLIEATLAEGTNAETAEVPDNYEITVGGENVTSTAVTYDATTTIASLAVDLTGLSGECIVNGISALVDVPPIPVFESIDTLDFEEEVILHFNTAVYDLDGTLGAAGDFTVTTDGNPNVLAGVIVAASAADAEPLITIELTDPTAGDTTTAIQLTSEGAAKIANIWDETTSAATRSELTEVDDIAPLFTGVRFIEGGYTLYLDFSERVHSDNQPIPADQGDASDWIRVTVNGVRVAATANVQIDRADRTDSITIDLDLDTADLLAAGDTVEVTLDSDLLDDGVANRIRDNVGNTLEGDRVRTGVAVSGPGLVDAEVSDLFFSDVAEQTFTFSLEGMLEDTERVWIDVSDADAAVRAAYNAANIAGDVDVDHADLTVAYDNGNDRFVVLATGDIANGTTVVVTVGPVNTAAAATAADVEVIFQRRDVGTTTQDTFNVEAGMSDLNVISSWWGLRSGLNNQDMGMSALRFSLQGGLATGQTVTIDLSTLQTAGVDFSRVDDDETIIRINGAMSDKFDFSMEGPVVNLTANDDMSSGDDVRIDFRNDLGSFGIIDVAPGATGDDYTVTFVRSDSSYLGEFDAEITANIIESTATNLSNQTPNQLQTFTFIVDGDLAQNEFIEIVVIDGNIDYGDVATFAVSGADASVVSVTPGAQTVIRVRADAFIECGTIVTVTANDVETFIVNNNSNIEVRIERLDTGNRSTTDFDVGSP